MAGRLRASGKMKLITGSSRKARVRVRTTTERSPSVTLRTGADRPVGCSIASMGGTLQRGTGEGVHYPGSVVRIALGQIDCTVGDLDGNVAKMAEWTARAN